MKVGRASWWSDVEVPLPSEVIELIVAFVNLEQSPDKRQRHLWSCCFVSKSWYHVAVPLLYYAPVLTGRNFTEFARTISPPLNARAPLIGLEDLVHHLDMGILAYEPRKSTTARLIRRTKHSLKTFVAPAVSFSVNCLAPLSKCMNLKVLDLSRDAYDIKLTQLLSSVRQLDDLWYLSLPKGIINQATTYAEFPLGQEYDENNTWPAHLSHLTLNSGHPDIKGTWKAFVSDWPLSLYSLSLVQCAVMPFRFLSNIDEPRRLGQITHLTIDSQKKTPEALLSEIVLDFPNVRVLEVSAVPRWHSGADPDRFGSLEHLILRYCSDFVALGHITPDYLIRLILSCRNLIRIDVPETYIDFEQDEGGELIDHMNALLDARVEERAKNGRPVKEFGVFLLEVVETGPGLKRSLQYPGD